MAFEDIPDVMIPLPDNFDDFKRPIFITKDYYDTLPNHEKSHYSIKEEIK